ncbi:hypothetical protein PCL_06808 [Purpureocillium lilacinum]|uniref:MARVEL domain-containing protein n=1 Tax=Purpureocillium lilacinum TaxID=33203 RepID=A0A2U3DTM2_PURLI|nr:hypothetical protein PCL_06808 [Purpureocillium lilacinum]
MHARIFPAPPHYQSHPSRQPRTHALTQLQLVWPIYARAVQEYIKPAQPPTGARAHAHTFFPFPISSSVHPTAPLSRPFHASRTTDRCDSSFLSPRTIALCRDPSPLPAAADDEHPAAAAAPRASPAWPNGAHARASGFEQQVERDQRERRSRALLKSDFGSRQRRHVFRAHFRVHAHLADRDAGMHPSPPRTPPPIPSETAPLDKIPMMGMLAWFINIFVSHNALTPDPILILFITSVLALAWAVFTLFSYHRSSANARLVSLVDMGIFGTLIAGVYLLRGIADADCSDDPSQSRLWTNRVAVPAVVDWQPNKPCAMLKASWAFAIMNIIFFFTTAVAAFSHGDSLSAYYGDERVVRTRHTTHYHHGGRHGHRHHSRSRSGGSRRSHSHSRRVYV